MPGTRRFVSASLQEPIQDLPDGGFHARRKVRAVREGGVGLVDADEAGRAVSLLELFIAGCYEKSEEIDDSDGTFGAFVGQLFCDWIRARQTVGLSSVSDFPSDGRPDGAFPL